MRGVFGYDTGRRAREDGDRWTTTAATTRAATTRAADDQGSEDKTEGFEQHRAHLRAVAYRMLGSYGEAEDAVQEAWVRYSRTDNADVENLAPG